MLDAKDAPAGKMDVVMQNGWGGVLVHEAVGHPLEARQHRQEDRRLHRQDGPEGRQPIFTMVDDGTAARTSAARRTSTTRARPEAQRPDRERRARQVHDRHPLGQADQDGAHRQRPARELPLPAHPADDQHLHRPGQGQARRHPRLDEERPLRHRASAAEASTRPPGVFNFTCREAYLIEDGKKTTPVKGATLIGSCLDVIRNIDAVGDDLDFGPGICGKGQAAEVTAGQPTVRIRGINVGGTRAAR